MTSPVQDRPIAWTRANPDPLAGYDDEARIDLGAVVRAMRRQVVLVTVCALAGIAIAVLMILGSVPRYTAVETVLLDEDRADLLNEVSPLPNVVRSDTAVQSEIQIIQSRALAYQVVDRLNLDEDADFLSPPVGATQKVIGSIGALTDPLARLISPAPPERPADAGADAGSTETSAEQEALGIEATDRDRAAEILRARLGASRAGRSLVIEISYRGYDPMRAALIARGYGAAYERFQLENTTEVASSAETWLRERLKRLEQQSIDAAAAVQEFRSKNNLMQARGNLLTEQQQSELASELVAAAADAAEASAQLESMESLLERAANGEDIVTVPLAEGSLRSNVEELRREYFDARLRYRRLIEQYGEDHPQAQGLKGSIEDLRQAIQLELEQATEAARVAYNVARSREESLRTNLDTATDTTNAGDALRGRLQQLEAISETYSQVYRDYLSRLEVTLQQQGFPIASVKVISQAEVPDGASSPQKKAMLLSGMLLGGFIGLMIGAIWELLPKPVRTGSTLSRDTGLPCVGLLPTGRGASGSDRVRRRTVERLAQVCEARLQPDRGTLIGLAPLTADLDRPDELPAALAARLSRQGARKVLLIRDGADGDKLGQSADGTHEVIGLSRMLASYAPDTDHAGADVARMVEDLRQEYDVVLLQMQPLARTAASDPNAWAYDLTLLRVPWGQVQPGFVTDALRDHPRFTERLETTVLEDAELSRARKYMRRGSYEELATHA